MENRITLKIKTGYYLELEKYFHILKYDLLIKILNRQRLKMTPY